MALTSRQILGKTAEHYALRFLLDQGLRLVERNWHCRRGEIDLIMQQQELLVFIEVRLRTHQQVSAEESVDVRKQAKLIASAQTFLLAQPQWQQHACRFDVIAVRQQDKSFNFNWIQGAFDAQ